MKILLLNTPLKEEKISRDMAGGLGFDATSQTLLPPLDLALLAAQLRRKKHQVRIIDPEVKDWSKKKVLDEILSYHPEIIIASVSLPSLENDAQFIKELGEKLKAKIIAKTSITFKPLLKKVLNQSRADFCLVGEVDLNILWLVESTS